MFRKIISLFVALIVAGGVMIAVPADAAIRISNGVACTKVGATTKTSFGSYKCAKNPLVSSVKLIWLSIDCLAAAKSAVKTQEAAVITVANFKAQLPVIELGITAEIANRAEAEAKLAIATARLTGAQAKLAIATTDAAKRSLATAVSSWTAATRAYDGMIRRVDLTIKRLEAAKIVAINKPAELVKSVAEVRAGAKAICVKGF